MAKWKLGDRVTSHARLRRRVTSDPKTWEVKRKTWEVEEVSPEPITGILTGVRFLQNGYMIWLGPENGWGWRQEGTVRAALIATRLHRAPALVPLDALAKATGYQARDAEVQALREALGRLLVATDQIERYDDTTDVIAAADRALW